jgi:outer membrane protein assembly factor BamB
MVALGLSACGALTASASRSTSGSEAGRATAASVPTTAWPTFGYDAARSGVGPGAGITAANVSGLRLRTLHIDGIADSAPIEVNGVTVGRRQRDVAVVTTSYGETIAFDPGTGAKLWEFRAPHVRPGSSEVTTTSPAVDPNDRFVYTAASNGVAYKLALANGRKVWSRSITFDPVHEKIASALNLSGRYVVAVTGGYYGDAPPYDGHVVMINRATGRIAHVWNTECSDRHQLLRASSCGATNTRGDNAIWGRAGAVIEPGSHRILVATGNGPFDGRTNWGNSVLELTPTATRLLHNWTPTNWSQLDHSDTDIGSASPAVLPSYRGYRLAVQAAKDGELHLLNLNRLNGTRAGAGGRTGGELMHASSPGGSEVLTQPAVWRSGGRIWVFAADDSGTAAYTVTGRRPRLRTVWTSGEAGTSPVLSGGLLYVYDEQAGHLVIRRPGTGAVLRSLPLAGGHWNSPLVASGRIIEPTGSYHSGSGSSDIYIWHVPGR